MCFFIFFFDGSGVLRDLHSFPTRRSSDLYSPADLIDPVSTLSGAKPELRSASHLFVELEKLHDFLNDWTQSGKHLQRSEEHTSELQSQSNLVCRLLLEKKKQCCHPTNR